MNRLLSIWLITSPAEHLLRGSQAPSLRSHHVARFYLLLPSVVGKARSAGAALRPPNTLSKASTPLTVVIPPLREALISSS
jgi:hypothetical protein